MLLLNFGLRCEEVNFVDTLRNPQESMLLKLLEVFPTQNYAKLNLVGRSLTIDALTAKQESKITTCMP
jgi:hypothetical protein